MTDWNSIKAEYLQGKTSYRKLAVKYGVSKSAIEKRSRSECWRELMKEICKKTEAKTADMVSDKAAEELVKIYSLVDEAFEELKKAMDNPDVFIRNAHDFHEYVVSLATLIHIKRDQLGILSSVEEAKLNLDKEKFDFDKEKFERHQKMLEGAIEDAPECGVVLIPAIVDDSEGITITSKS